MATPNVPPGTSQQPVVLVPATLLHPNNVDAPRAGYTGTGTHGIAPTTGHTAIPIKETATTTATPMSHTPTTEPMTPTSTKTKKGCFGRTKKEKPVKQVDARKAKHTKSKLLLWIIWLLMMLVSAGYCVIAIISFKNLHDIYKNRDETIQGNQLWGILTATILTPALIIAFFFLGSILLLRKTVSETGLTFTYGIFTASAFWLSALVLLSTLVEHAYNDVAHGAWKRSLNWSWTNGDANLLKATWIVGYALAGLYFLLFLILLAMQKAIKRVNYEGATVANAAHAK